LRGRISQVAAHKIASQQVFGRTGGDTPNFVTLPEL
jgi:hypothetical protein